MVRCASTGFLMAKPRTTLFGEMYSLKKKEKK
jgi:hypothetical protein